MIPLIVNQACSGDGEQVKNRAGPGSEHLGYPESDGARASVLPERLGGVLMFAGIVLALSGIAFGLLSVYAFRLFHARACGCVSCLAFVERHSLRLERKP
jgi:hypothetical protein